MTIVDVLRAENDKSLQLVRQLETTSSGGAGERARLLHELWTHLEAKHRAEERNLYALVSEEAGLSGVVQAARQNGRVAEKLARSLDVLATNDFAFMRGVRVLHDLLERHASWQECELATPARSLLGEGSAEPMAQQLRREKREMELPGSP